MKAIKAKFLDINIRSIGGSVNDALLIHSAICSLQNVSVTTICHGFTASAATLIAQSGKTRKVCSNSLYLVHQSINVAYGNANMMKESLSDLEKVDTIIAGLYASRSGNTIESCRELIGRNNGNGEWLTPQEVIDLKLADEILPLTSSVNLDTDLFNEFGYPQIPENLIPVNKVDEGVFNHLYNNFINFINNSKMKKDWKTVNQILNVEGLELKEGAVSIQEAQMQIIEDKFTSMNSALDAEKEKATTAENKLNDATAKITEKDTEIAGLKTQIENLKNGAGDTTHDVRKETDNVDGNKETDDFFNTAKSAMELYKILP